MCAGMASRNAQDSATSAASSAAAASLAGDTLRCLDDRGERAVAALHVELERPLAADVRRCDLGHAMLESIRHVDLDAMVGAGHRVLDRLDVGLQDAGNLQARLAALLVEAEADRREDGIVHPADDQAEDVEE